MILALSVKLKVTKIVVYNYVVTKVAPFQTLKRKHYVKRIQSLTTKQPTVNHFADRGKEEESR